jgi:hypothetical protein
MWGKTPTSGFKPPFDVILASDVLYEKKYVNPFLRTAYKLAGDDTLFINVFQFHGNDAVEVFFEKVGKYFTYSTVRNCVSVSIDIERWRRMCWKQKIFIF